MKLNTFLISLAAATGISGAAHALPVSDWNITYAGSQTTYDLGGDMYLSLMGISSGAEEDVAYNTSDLLNYFGGAATAAYYSMPLSGNASYDDGAWTGGPSEFQEFGSTFEIDELNRESTGTLFDSFYIKYTATGPNFVYNNPVKSTQTIGLSNAIDEDPLAPIPVPAALPLMLLGLGSIGAVGLRRRAKKTA